MHATGGNGWTVGRRTKPCGCFSSGRWQRFSTYWRPRGDAFLVQLIDLCLLSLLFVAPLLMGGRHPVGQLAWILLAAVLAVATLLHYRPCKPSAGDWIWLAAVGLVMLQLVPLSANQLILLNPGLVELLPGISDPSQLPFGEVIYGNRPISINPYRTRLALGMLLAYGVIFHAVTRRVQTTADVRRLLSWIATATVAISILALAQRFAGNGKFLWVYQHISRSASDVVKGPFQNQNHLAQLMALGLGPLLYFAISRAGYWKTVLATSGMTLCLLSGLLTFSRGGAIAIATAGFVTFAGLAYTGHVNRRHWLRIALPSLLTVGLLGIWGGEKLLTRVETLAGSANISSVAPGRIELWQAHLKGIAASPWVGYGAACHEDIYRAFIEKDFGVKFTHGESGYLPIQLEDGLLGAILLACALLFAIRCGWQSLRASTSTANYQKTAQKATDETPALAVTCIAGLAASAVQSLGDFVWYIPACLTPTLMLLACLSIHATRSRVVGPTVYQDRTNMFRLPWLAIPSALLIAAATWSIGPARASHLWTQYRTLESRAAAERGTGSTTKPSSTERLSLLKAIVDHDPLNPVPRLRLAAALLSASDVSDRQDTPVEDRSVLDAAVRHTLISLQRAPLRGEGYLLLADICRRTDGNSERQHILLKQAIRVCRNDTDVCFKAGISALQSGQIEWGFETWRPILEDPTRKRDQFLRLVAEQFPAQVLLQSFSFDHEALTILYYHHQSSDFSSPELSTDIGHELVDSLIRAAGDELSSPTEAASLFHRASRVLEQIKGSPAQILELQSRAVAASPSEYPYRIRFARLLIRGGRWKDATEHLRWCKSRRPSDPEIRRQTEILLRRRQQSQASS